MKIFAQLTKVDAEKRLVYGRAAQEIADKSGEIMDYKSSKPEFQKWSETFEKTTDGKSKGNIRSMHGKNAVGKVEEIEFNDEEKAIDVCAKIVDDQEWKKVQEGVYTGFSIGGSYLKKWEDGDLQRYTASPAEISIVDNPCMPSATFKMIKADGIEEDVEFKQPEVSTLLKQVWLTPDGETFDKKTDAVSHLSDNIEDILNKKKFTQKEREADAKSGKAQDDGSYPIENKGQLKDAIQAYGRSKNKAKTKKHIMSRAKALDAMDMIPENWTKGEANKAALAEALAKNEVCDAATALMAVQNIEYLLTTELLEDEQDAEQIADLQDALKSLKSFISSEISEGDDEGAEKMAKVVGERDEALAKVDEFEKKFSAILTRLEKVESQPQPPKGAVRAVTKEEDSTLSGEAAELKKHLNLGNTTPEEARDAMSKILAKAKKEK